MQKCMLLLLFLSINHFQSFSQIEKIKVLFFEDSIDIGNFYSDDEPEPFQYKYVNKGNEVLTLTEITSGSKNISLEKNYHELKKGEVGYVKGIFSPENGSGRMVSSITLTFNSRYQKKLYLKAHVTPAAIDKKIEFPEFTGPIRYKNDYLNFGNVKNNRIIKKNFTLYNSSNKTITFNPTTFSSKVISASVEPSQIKPKSKALLNVHLNPSSIKKNGYFNTQLVLFTSDSAVQEIKFNIVATIIPFYPDLTDEQLKQKPKVQFESEEYDFGYLNQGDTVSHTFIVKNVGKEPFKISRVDSYCSCLQIEQYDEIVTENETGELSIRFITTNKVGNQHRRISIYNNDPRNPIKDILIKAYIRTN